MGVKFHCAYFSVFLACLLGYSVQVFAQISDTAVVEKNGRKFHQHIVEQGNTLYFISKKFGVSVKDIEEFNPGVSNGLRIGDTLMIIAITEDKKVIEKQMEVNGNFIVHEVQKGQTLYAISKTYNIDISELIIWNPELKDGVKEGQLLKIPVAKLKKQAPKVEMHDSLVNRIIHVVKPKETLYSLSVFYKVHIDSIKAANQGLPEGLKEGAEIIIPRVAADERISQDTTEKKKVYRVGIILPFFLNENDTLMANLKLDEKESVLSKSYISIQFYEGCMLALDSLKKLGMEFHVEVFESENDTLIARQLIDQGKLADLDLIIGPLYYSNFVLVADYAREHKIHIVCPVPQNNRILLGNPYVSKVATSKNILYSRLAQYVCDHHRSENIIIINKNFRVNPLADQFKSEYRRQLELQNDTARYRRNLKEVRWDDGSIEPILAQLSDSVVNLIVIPSNDQVYVTELLSRLNHVHKKYMFKVIGIDNWLKYTNVDFQYFENLNVMIPLEGFVDYNRPETKAFIRKCYDTYNTFPEKYTFLGFDITFYYLKLLNQSGTRIENDLEKTKGQYYYLSFNFFKTGIESGYENNSMVLVRYGDFQLNRVPILD